MKMKHNDELTEILKSVDTRHHYKKYDAGYHDSDMDDVIIEFGFNDLKVYIPTLWNRTSGCLGPIKREILSLAYRRSLGEKLPAYGPKALAWMYMSQGYVADRHYRGIEKMDLSADELKAIGLSHWTISKKLNRYMLRRYDFDGPAEREAPKRWRYYCLY